MEPSWPGLQGKASLTTALVVVLLTAGIPLAQATHEDHSTEPEDTWIVHTTVEADVVDNYATVKVIAQIDNRGPDPEFPFKVQIPDRAMVTGLTIERDGKIYNGTIEERADAREQYEQAREEHRSAGLVEKQRHASVYAYRINVEATESLRAELTYEMYLTADRGIYELPLVAPVSGFGYDTGATFDVSIQHTDGVETAWSSPNGDVPSSGDAQRIQYHVGHREPENATELDVHYTLEPTDRSGSVISTVHDGTGYFAHRFRAAPNASDLPLDLALVLDVSGSMSGAKIEQVKDATRQVISRLDAEDRLHLTFFSSDTRTPWQTLRPVDANTTQDAIEAIDSVIAGGGTHMAPGIRAAFQAHNATEDDAAERLRAVAFLTDGRASGTNDELRELARASNTVDAHVFGLAFGAQADWELIHGLATDGDGIALRVPSGAGAEVDLRRFLGALTTPVLKDVQLIYPDDVRTFGASAPVLFAGSELLVLGTFDGDRSSLDVTVDAQTRDGPIHHERSHDIQEDASAEILPRIVAYHRIQDLQDRLDAGGPVDQLAANITSLGLEHGFVTDYTSLVLDLPEQTQTTEDEQPAEPHDAEDCCAASSPTAGGGGGDSTADRSTQRSVDQDTRSSSGSGTVDETSRPSSDTNDGSDAPMERATDDATETPALGVMASLAAIAVVGFLARRTRREP